MEISDFPMENLNIQDSKGFRINLDLFKGRQTIIKRILKPIYIAGTKVTTFLARQNDAVIISSYLPFKIQKQIPDPETTLSRQTTGVKGSLFSDCYLPVARRYISPAQD